MCLADGRCTGAGPAGVRTREETDDGAGRKPRGPRAGRPAMSLGEEPAVDVAATAGAPPPIDAAVAARPMLVMRGVTKTFPGVTAVDDASLDVRPGEIHAMIGENGAGKSTLMHLVAGVYQPDSGEIELDGRSLLGLTEQGAADAGVAMVFQERSLVGALSVAENVFAGRQPTNRFGVIRRGPMFERTREILADLEVDIDPGAEVGNLSPGPAADGRDRQGPVARAEAPDPRRADVVPDHQRGPAPLPGAAPAGGAGRRDRLRVPPPGRGLRDRQPRDRPQGRQGDGRARDLRRDPRRPDRADGRPRALVRPRSATRGPGRRRSPSR